MVSYEILKDTPPLEDHGYSVCTVDLFYTTLFPGVVEDRQIPDDR